MKFSVATIITAAFITPIIAAGDQPTPCANACNKAFYACKAQPNENNAYCVATYSGCLGYNPFENLGPNDPYPVPTKCQGEDADPKSCQGKLNACEAKPGSNKSLCQSRFAGCKATCTKAHDACNVKPNANHSYCAATYAGCLGYNPYSN